MPPTHIITTLVNMSSRVLVKPCPNRNAAYAHTTVTAMMAPFMVTPLEIWLRDTISGMIVAIASLANSAGCRVNPGS